MPSISPQTRNYGATNGPDRSIYLVNSDRGELVHSIKAPVPIRCGFATVSNAVYFASNAELWRYEWPRSEYLPRKSRPRRARALHQSARPDPMRICNGQQCRLFRLKRGIMALRMAQIGISPS